MSFRLPNIDHCSGLMRPRWRGRVHALAALLAVPAGLLLVTRASSHLAAAVFAVSLFAVYATSAAYHTLARSPWRQQLFRRLDHAMIYILIAGTYTPLCLVGLPRSWGVPLAVAVWLGAALGVVLCLLWRARRVASALYLVLGWAVIVAMPKVWATTGPLVGTLLAVGGVAYTTGAVLFGLNRPRLAPSVFGYHELWHVFTIVAGTAHFAAVASIVA